MSEDSSPICSPDHNSSPKSENKKAHVENSTNNENFDENTVKNRSFSNNNGSVMFKRERPSRACTQRAAARLQAAAQAEAAILEKERKRKKGKRRQKLASRLLKEESEEEDYGFRNDEDDDQEGGNGNYGEEEGQCSKIMTQLVGEPEPSQLLRWNIRSMWQLASILNFLNVFRPLLNIKAEFSVEELETALIMPNNTLADIHMPLLKAIPPVTRMALGYGTWITVLCRKLRDWWHWVAEGDLPLVASHGAEIEAYNALDPGVRVVILKALCDIRVEQEDVRNYIDDSIKHGVPLSAFRKERIGGDSHGISYWYENDPVIGYRLYREIRKVEVIKGKGKNVPPIPHPSYQWETVATNFDEFQSVTEKLCSSTNRTEISVGKKLTNNMLPEIEKVHKRKEKQLKKQHRQALMLDNMMNMDGLVGGRSLRDRKQVTYTFDDYDRSINEAIKVTKTKQPSPEPLDGQDPPVKLEALTNGRSVGPSKYSRNVTFSAPSPESTEDDEFDEDQQTEALDRSNRRRQRPQRYSVKDFIEDVSDNDPDFDSDDDIVGEVVYDEEYLKKRKQKRKVSSSSEGDEEYNLEEENHEEEELEEDNDDSNLSTSEESDEPRKSKNSYRGRTRRETKSRRVDEFQSGLRRSKRATRNSINYRQYEISESETEPEKSKSKSKSKSNGADDRSNESENEDFSMGSQDSEENFEIQENEDNGNNDDNNDDNNDNNDPIDENPIMVDQKGNDPVEKSSSGDQEGDGEKVVKKRRFLDLNELAPGSGFDDGLNPTRDEDDF